MRKLPVKFEITAETARRWSTPNDLEKALQKISLFKRKKATGELELNTLAFLEKQKLSAMNQNITRLNNEEMTQNYHQRFMALNELGVFLRKAYNEISLRNDGEKLKKYLQQKLNVDAIRNILLDENTVLEVLKENNTLDLTNHLLLKLGIIHDKNDESLKAITKQISKEIDHFKKTTQNIPSLINHIIATITKHGNDIKEALLASTTMTLNDHFIENTQRYITNFQDQCEKQIDFTTNKMIDVVENHLKKGLLPTNSEEKKELYEYTNLLNEHHLTLQAQANNAFSEEKDRIRLENFEERVNKLYLFKSQSQKNNTKKSIATDILLLTTEIRNIANILNIEIEGGAFDNIPTDKNKLSKLFDLAKKIKNNPLIILAKNTSEILKANEKFKSPYDEAEFLIQLEKQLEEAKLEFEKIAQSIKFPVSAANNKNKSISWLKLQKQINARKKDCVERIHNDTTLKLFQMIPRDRYSDNAEINAFVSKLIDKIGGSQTPEEIKEALTKFKKTLSHLKTTNNINTVDLNERIDFLLQDIDNQYAGYLGNSLSVDLLDNVVIERIDDKKLILFYNDILSREEINKTKEVLIKIINEILNRLFDKKNKDRNNKEEFIKILTDFCNNAENINDEFREELQLKLRVAERIHTNFIKSILIKEKEEKLKKSRLISAEYRKKISKQIQAANKTIDLIIKSDRLLDEFILDRNNQLTTRMIKRIQIINRALKTDDTNVIDDFLSTPEHGDEKKKNDQKINREKTENEINERLKKSITFIENLSPFISDKQTLSELNKDYGYTYDLSKNTEKKLFDEAQKRAKDIVLRHKIRDEILESDEYNELANPRSIYLASLTPQALKLVDKQLEKILNQINQESIIKTQIENEIIQDIQLTRQEIAISMLERLRLAKYNIPADLIANLHNELLSTPPLEFSDLFTLSDEQILDYYRYIENHGDFETRDSLSIELGDLHEILTVKYKLFDRSLKDYLESKSTNKNEDEITNKAQQLERNATWLPKKITGETNQDYLKRFDDALSPTKIINKKSKLTIWINDKKNSINKKTKDIESLEKEIFKQEQVLKNKKESLDRFNSWSRFQQSLATAFSWFTDGGRDNRETLYIQALEKITSLKNIKNDLVASNNNDINLLKQHTLTVSRHIIDNIRNEIANGDNNVSKHTELNDTKTFIAEHTPELLPILERKLDYAQDFLSSIAASDDISELTLIANYIKATTPSLKNSVENILSILNGRWPYDTKTISSFKEDFSLILKNTNHYQALKTDQEKNKFIDDQYEIFTTSTIKDNFLAPIIDNAIQLGSDHHKDLNAMLQFFNSEEIEALYDNFQKTITNSLEKLSKDERKFFDANKPKSEIREKLSSLSQNERALDQLISKLTAEYKSIDITPQRSFDSMTTIEFEKYIEEKSISEKRNKTLAAKAKELFEANEARYNIFKEKERTEAQIAHLYTDRRNSQISFSKKLALLPAFKNIQNFKQFRNKLFEKINQHLEFAFENDTPDYLLDDFQNDTTLLQNCETCRLESDTHASLIFNDAFSLQLKSIIQKSNRKWNPYLACLIEKFGNNEVKSSYRILRLKEMISLSELDTSRNDDEEQNNFGFFILTRDGDGKKYDSFVSGELHTSSNERGGTYNLNESDNTDQKSIEIINELNSKNCKATTNSEKEFLAFLVRQSDTQSADSSKIGQSPSWMTYIIVDRIGSEEQKKTLLTNWALSSLSSEAIKNEKNNDILYDIIQNELIKNPSNLPLKNRFENFIGNENYKKIELKLSALISATTGGKLKDARNITNLAYDIVHNPNTDQKISIIENIEEMRAFNGAFMNLMFEVYIDENRNLINQNIQTLTTLHDFVELIDHLTRDPHKLITQLSEITAYLKLPTSQKMEFLKKNDHNSIAQLIKKTHERSDVNFDHLYNYEKNPSLFYTIFLSKAQDAVKKVILDTLTTTPNTGNLSTSRFTEYHESLEMLSAKIKAFENQLINSVTPKDIDPILMTINDSLIFNDDIINIETLKKKLELLHGDDFSSNIASVKNWLIINGSSQGIGALVAYVMCCEKTNELYKLTKAAKVTMQLEKSILAIIEGKNLGIHIRDIINKNKDFFTTEPSDHPLNKRVNQLIPLILKTLEQRVDILLNGTDTNSDKFSEIKSIIDTFGNDYQKVYFSKIEKSFELFLNPSLLNDDMHDFDQNMLVNLIDYTFKNPDLTKGGYINLLRFSINILPLLNTKNKERLNSAHNHLITSLIESGGQSANLLGSLLTDTAILKSLNENIIRNTLIKKITSEKTSQIDEELLSTHCIPFLLNQLAKFSTPEYKEIELDAIHASLTRDEKPQFESAHKKAAVQINIILNNMIQIIKTYGDEKQQQVLQLHLNAILKNTPKIAPLIKTHLSKAAPPTSQLNSTSQKNTGILKKIFGVFSQNNNQAPFNQDTHNNPPKPMQPGKK